MGHEMAHVVAPTINDLLSSPEFFLSSIREMTTP